MLSSLFRTSDGTGPVLRVGVLLDGFTVPAHVAAILEDIRQSNFARLALVMVRGETGGGEEGARSSFLYRACQRYYARRSVKDDPCAPVSCSEALEGIERLEVQPAIVDGAEHLPPTALGAIRERGLDVLVCLGSARPAAELGTCARYGAWWYHHGDERYYRGESGYFWEVYERRIVTGTALRAVDGRGQELTLCRSLFATSDSLCTSQNRYAPLWESTHFVVWKLHDLHLHGWDELRRRAAPSAYQGRRDSYTAPTNGEMLRLMGATVVRKAIPSVLNRMRHITWRVALRCTRAPLTEDVADVAEPSWCWLEEPAGHYYADPFLVEHERKRYLFVEDYLHERGYAVISSAEVLSTGEVGPMRPCLDVGTHLSYPMVFSHDGQLWMIPESGSLGEVALYRRSPRRERWDKVKVLFDACRAVDTTVHHQDGRWWFFTTLSDRTGAPAPKLVLFHADSLTGKWVYHPANPISSDVRDARGAGAMFRHDGMLVRPTQCCAPVYGRSITLHEVLELTRTTYRERQLRVVEPSWAPRLLGTHTYAFAGGIEVLDACERQHRRRVRRPVRDRDGSIERAGRLRLVLGQARGQAPAEQSLAAAPSEPARRHLPG